MNSGQTRFADDYMLCPLVVLDKHGSKIVLARAETGFCLPSARISTRVRPAKSLTTATEQLVGPITVHSFSVASGSSQPPYWVMECVHDHHVISPPFAWKPIRELSAEQFANPQDFAAVSDAMHREQTTIAVQRTPSCALHWFENVREWVTSKAKENGQPLTGRFQQWNAAPGFSLIRFETERSALWFKAVAGPLEHEGPVTRRLSELFPTDLPKILGFRPDWNAWLAGEAEGSCLDEICCPEAWQYVAARLAKLQIASLDHIDAIREAGAADLTSGISRRIDLLFTQAGTAMAQQEKSHPAALTPSQLDVLRTQVEQALADLAQIGAPECLGHLDFNPGNVIVSREGSCTFLDWAEAYAGYPFATFEYLLQHFRRTDALGLKWEQGLQEAYWRPWNQILSGDQARRARRLTPLMAVFLYAENLRAQRRCSGEPVLAGYLRSLFRRMKQEADLIGNPGCCEPLPA